MRMVSLDGAKEWLALVFVLAFVVWEEVLEWNKHVALLRPISKEFFLNALFPNTFIPKSRQAQIKAPKG